MRILSVSSQVAFGPVGNTAAIPAMQAAGHEVLGVPTIILSNHPGHGKPAALRMPAPDLAAMLGTLDDLGALSSCGAVMTGYFAANDQIYGTARMIRRMKEKNPSLFVLVDPVIGDHEALYVPVPVATSGQRPYGSRSSWGSRDNDGDGIPNRYDRDRNNDGIPDAVRRDP